MYYKNYSSHESCLKHIRIQLVTLFFTTSVLLSWGTRVALYLYRRLFKQNYEDPGIETVLFKEKQENSKPFDIENIENNKWNTNENSEINPLLNNKKNISSYHSNNKTSINTKFTVNHEIIDDAKYQLNLDDPPEVLDAISDIVTQFGYLTWFSFVFPCMPIQTKLKKNIQISKKCFFGLFIIFFVLYFV